MKLRDDVTTTHAHENDSITSTLASVRTFLGSRALGRYLHAITSLEPRRVAVHARRFRPGLDYTVAHFGTMTAKPKLDATLCFVLTSAGMKKGLTPPPQPVKEVKNGDEDGHESGHESDESEDEDSENEKDEDSDTDQVESDEDEDDDDEDEEEDEESEEDHEFRDLWASGDVGGFECYVEADEDSPDASEVYQTTANKAGQEKETSLLSVSAGFNVLNVVLRDAGVMRFVKYVSAQALSSRWDVSAQYVLGEDV